jgi:hypothetical protein
MKTLFTLLFLTLISVTGLFAQDEGDAAYVTNWKFPIGWWFPNQAVPAEGIENYPRAQATAAMVTNFDAKTADFDAEWAKIAGNGNVIAHQLGLNASHKGAEDFKDAAFKAVYDESNIYILLQYTDDDVTGNETVEVAWAPYLKINAPEVAGNPVAWYARYRQFGAYKATFKKTGFDAAMIVKGGGAGADGSNGSLSWGGTNDTLSNNLFLDDHTAAGSKTVKQIITIGFPAFTGEARPDFNYEIWKSLNAGKGISFDLKVNDVDTDDALNSDATPVQKPAEYWWNTTNNDAYAVTYYAGFLNPAASAPVDGDAAYVANWKFPIGWWFPNQAVPAEGIENYPRKVAKTGVVTSFDAQTANFDTEWARISGNGNAIANQLGLNASHKGAEDFKDASFKAFADGSNIYILLQYTDDDVTGNETVEVAWAPYFKINAPEVEGNPVAWYARYRQFGAYKATFKKTGFDAAMIVKGGGTGSDGSNGSLSWGGTNDTLSNNLFLDDKTAAGSKTVKQIITIGFPALTGEARPDFNMDIWKALNGGKGISFDLKVNDVDTDDALNSDATPVQKPAEYWWNSTNNDAYAVTYYAGFLAVGNTVGFKQLDKTNSIFQTVTPDRIQLKQVANVAIYNALGAQIVSKRNVNQIDLSNLNRGIYIIRANNESLKVVR